LSTFSAKPTDIKHDWYVVDAKDLVLGRLASQVAQILRGKHKPIYTPHMDTGDFVVIINAEKVRLTGNKAESKICKGYGCIDVRNNSLRFCFFGGLRRE